MNKKIELVWNQEDWQIIETEKLLSFTKHMQDKDKYHKYPHTHRFGREYKGNAIKQQESSYLEPEKGWLKYLLITGVLLLVLLVGSLCLGR